jgi:hypothetical protein
MFETSDCFFFHLKMAKFLWKVDVCSSGPLPLLRNQLPDFMIKFVKQWNGDSWSYSRTMPYQHSQQENCLSRIRVYWFPTLVFHLIWHTGIFLHSLTEKDPWWKEISGCTHKYMKCNTGIKHPPERRIPDMLHQITE